MHELYKVTCSNIFQDIILHFFHEMTFTLQENRITDYLFRLSVCECALIDIVDLNSKYGTTLFMEFGEKNNGLANICPKGQKSVAQCHQSLLALPMNA